MPTKVEIKYKMSKVSDGLRCIKDDRFRKPGFRIYEMLRIL